MRERMTCLSANERVLVLQVFLEGCNGEQRSVGLNFGVVCNVNIDQLLDLQVCADDIFYNIRK